jgi:hypothetical protein
MKRSDHLKINKKEERLKTCHFKWRLALNQIIVNKIILFSKLEIQLNELILLTNGLF